MVNFLPSVDDFWVFGNTIYKDYYVYHNPESGIMGWVPTAQKLKSALKKGARPTKVLMEKKADYSHIFGRLLLALASAGATVAAAMLLFTTSFTGLAILNQASLTKKEKSH